VLRLHLTVLTTRNETLGLRKRISKFSNSSFMLAVCSVPTRNVEAEAEAGSG